LRRGAETWNIPPYILIISMAILACLACLSGVRFISPSGPELRVHPNGEIRQCLSRVLHLGVEGIDDRAAIADLGVDSVMTVALRQTMGVKVPPTLAWNYPTVAQLVWWF